MQNLEFRLDCCVFKIYRFRANWASMKVWHFRWRPRSLYVLRGVYEFLQEGFHCGRDGYLAGSIVVEKTFGAFLYLAGLRWWVLQVLLDDQELWPWREEAALMD